MTLFIYTYTRSQKSMPGESGYVHRVGMCGRRDGVGEINSTVLSHTVNIHGYEFTSSLTSNRTVLAEWNRSHLVTSQEGFRGGTSCDCI